MNPAKSNFVPAQRVQYLGTILDTQTFRASPSQERIDRLLSLGDEFLSSRLQSMSTWQALLGTLSSLSHLVPGSSPHVSSSARSPSFVGLPGRFLPRLLVGRLSPGSPLVDGPRPSLSRSVSVSALTRPRLLVRRVRHGLGCSPRSCGRFRSLVSGRSACLHQCPGVVGCGARSPPLSILHQAFHGRGVCGQLHGRGLSWQRRGHLLSGPQFHCPAYSPMVRTPPCTPGSPVHHGPSQCSGRFSISSGPDPGV